MSVRGGKASWSWEDLVRRAGDRLQRFEDDLRDDGLLVGDRLEADLSQWCALGTPPSDGRSEEEHVDAWGLLQSALFDGLGGGPRTLRIESVGFVGAPGATLRMRIDDAVVPTPLDFDTWARCVAASRSRSSGRVDARAYRIPR
jgi:hypothetical protein